MRPFYIVYRLSEVQHHRRYDPTSRPQDRPRSLSVHGFGEIFHQFTRLWLFTVLAPKQLSRPRNEIIYSYILHLQSPAVAGHTVPGVPRLSINRCWCVILACQVVCKVVSRLTREPQRC